MKIALEFLSKSMTTRKVDVTENQYIQQMINYKRAMLTDANKEQAKIGSNRKIEKKERSQSAPSANSTSHDLPQSK